MVFAGEKQCVWTKGVVAFPFFSGERREYRIILSCRPALCRGIQQIVWGRGILGPKDLLQSVILYNLSL